MLKNKTTPLVLLGTILLIIATTGCFSEEGNIQTGSGSDQTLEAGGPDKGEKKRNAKVANKAITEKPLSLEIVSEIPAVSPGGDPITLFVKTEPGTICDIEVGYKVGSNEADALFSKEAGTNGFVSWTWTVDPTVPLGRYPITIIANSPDGRSATAKMDIDIKSAEECKN